MKEGIVSLPLQFEMFPKIEVRKALLAHSSINGSNVVIDIDEIGYLLLDLQKKGQGLNKVTPLLISPPEVIKS
jgi:hypothetical protein